MSQALISASDIGLPSPVFWANAAPIPNEKAMMRAANGLCIDMFDLPFAVDRPAREAVVMLVGEGQRGRQGLPGLTPRRHEFGTQRLYVAGLVPGTTLQDRRLAIPAPRHHEAGEGLFVDGTVQRGFAPALAAVGRNHDLGDTSSTRIGDAGDGVEARLLQGTAERGVRDKALDLHEEVESPRLTAWQNLRIVLGLEKTHGRLIDH